MSRYSKIYSVWLTLANAHYTQRNELAFSARQRNFLSNRVAESSPSAAGLVKTGQTSSSWDKAPVSRKGGV